MGKYFGTDGYRGVANETLTVNTAFKIGQFLGHYYSNSAKGKILIGKDTRISSTMLEQALSAGVCSCGSDTYLLGVIPTPAVAYLVKNQNFDCGVMISASHNPFMDNGIKIFNHQGIKIDDELELMIEAFLDQETQIPLAIDEHIGISIDYKEGVTSYLDWMASLVDFKKLELKIVIDAANGASITTAKPLLKRFTDSVVAIHQNPNGININTDCGSTHPQSLSEAVRANQADVGFAFDGDADRLIAVDENGEIIDGDKMMYAIATYLKSKDLLEQNTIVATVMSNIGFIKATKQVDIDVAITQVGDKYVYAEMLKQNYILGGEQSGHIIFSKFATTGDGLLSALMLLQVMADTKLSLSALTKACVSFPQVLKNIKVFDKQAVMNDQDVSSLIQKISNELGSSGRILVRPSGTEQLIRVMVEAESKEVCEKMCNDVITLIQSKGLS